MFKLVKTLSYREVDILVIQDSDGKVYIPRDCVRKALKYTDTGQLSKMQSRYSKIFDTEYIRNFSIEIEDGSIISGTGLYTIKGAIEVCSHTQKFRGADIFIDFLRKEMEDIGIKEEFPKIDNLSALTILGKTERELLISMNLHLVRIEKMLESICDKLFEGDENALHDIYK